MTMNTTLAQSSLKQAKNVGILGVGLRSYKDQLERSNRVDLFKFKLPSSSSYRFDLQGLKANAALRLLDRKGHTLLLSNRPRTRAEVLQGNLAAGTYYLKVSLKQGRTAYQLKLATTASTMLGDGIESEELKLFDLLNQYRAQNNLLPIKLSKALTIVANRHVYDLAENIGELTHAWSDAPYDANNAATWQSMWTAPQRLNTGYPGYGYEIAFWISSGQVSASTALDGWKSSPGHNTVMINQGVWQNYQWNAVGVGMYKGYAVLWFGQEVDPAGQPLID